MRRLRLGVVGVGHLGKEHARILAGQPDVELVGVVDTNPDQARAVAGRCGCAAYTDHRDLLPDVDAAVVAVPTTHHHAVASDYLDRGVPLLIEKPLAATLEQAEALVEIANRRGVVLQVGHIERFNPAFAELLGRPLQPKFVECERLGSFTGRSTDIGVVLDLMIHDLDLLRALVAAPVRSVQALGLAVFGGQEDVAHARLEFANGCVATLTASRASFRAARSLRVWSPEGYASLDFSKRSVTLVQPSEQVRRHGLDPAKLDPAARSLLKDELFGRHLQVQTLTCPTADQLTLELRDFLRCVRDGDRPRVTGEDGREALALASRILAAIHQHQWDGHPAGPVGPHHLPAPLGPLFLPEDRRAAA
jgi:predicted dehydrogenase